MPSVPYKALLHDAALQHVERTAATWTANGSNCCESRQAAVFALGLIGSAEDIPLLERWFTQWDLEVPARAALARLGSADYIAQIKTALGAPLPTPFTEFDALKIANAIQSARFSERQELIPSLCRHLHTPASPNPTSSSPLPPAMHSKRFRHSSVIERQLRRSQRCAGRLAPWPVCLAGRRRLSPHSRNPHRSCIVFSQHRSWFVFSEGI